MSRRLILMLALVLGIGLIACAAYAEVQNVKVSGDLKVLGVARDRFSLTNTDPEHQSATVAITRVRIDADLTDNVATTVRLLNERKWGEEASANDTDIDLDLAYVTLKEFLYSPLTLIVGRQDIRLGSGLLIGDPDTNRVVNSVSALNGSTGNDMGDLSARKAFDAITWMLDYNPLTVGMGMIKVTNNNTIAVEHDDANLYYTTAGYDFGDKMDTKGELYVVYKDTRKALTDTVGKASTIGVRMTSTPMENLSASAELAYQAHKQNSIRPDRKTMSDTALLLGATMDFPDVKYTPTLGMDYCRLSQDWDKMYEDQTPAAIWNALADNTNIQVIGVTGTMKPMEDVVVKLRYANLAFIEGVSSLSNLHGSPSSMDADKKAAGNEVDLGLTYDYTEDVQLGLDLGYFMPGKAFSSDTRKTASQVIGSMKVTF